MSIEVSNLEILQCLQIIFSKSTEASSKSTENGTESKKFKFSKNKLTILKIFEENFWIFVNFYLKMWLFSANYSKTWAKLKSTKLVPNKIWCQKFFVGTMGLQKAPNLVPFGTIWRHCARSKICPLRNWQKT